MAGAQQAGAKLNQTISALGGSFDSVKMSMMDYPEQMSYLAETIQSVMPRIRAAGPRAQRLYMRSLASSLGMSVSNVRKFANLEVGGGMALEKQLAAGVMPQAMSADRERQLARGMLNMGDFKSRGKQIGIETVQAMGLRAAQVAGMPATTLAPRALRLMAPTIEKADDLEKFAVMGGKALESFLTKSGLNKQISDMVRNIKEFNDGMSTKTNSNREDINKIMGKRVGK